MNLPPRRHSAAATGETSTSGTYRMATSSWQCPVIGGISAALEPGAAALPSRRLILGYDGIDAYRPLTPSQWTRAHTTVPRSAKRDRVLARRQELPVFPIPGERHPAPRGPGGMTRELETTGGSTYATLKAGARRSACDGTSPHGRQFDTSICSHPAQHTPYRGSTHLSAELLGLQSKVRKLEDENSSNEAASSCP